MHNTTFPMVQWPMPLRTTESKDPNPKDKIGLTKVPIWLVAPASIIYEAQVMALGAKKYGPYNWRSHPVLLSVYYSAAQRHQLAFLDGETFDPESGLPHVAHAKACMGILLDAGATGNLIDDRPLPGAAARLLKEFTAKGIVPAKEAERFRSLAEQSDITRASATRLDELDEWCKRESGQQPDPRKNSPLAD